MHGLQEMENPTSNSMKYAAMQGPQYTIFAMSEGPRYMVTVSGFGIINCVFVQQKFKGFHACIYTHDCEMKA